MNIDLTKYLGEYGAAIAVMGVAVVAWLNNRTSNNLNTKLSNFESELIETRLYLNNTKEALQNMRIEFSEYRRNHP